MTKILLVDDSKFLRLATERGLARAGYDASTATDGEQALQMAREKRPDVIMLDRLLPKMMGSDGLKALKKDPSTAGIRVVVFTGRPRKKPRGCNRMERRHSWTIGPRARERKGGASDGAGGNRSEAQAGVSGGPLAGNEVRAGS
jgi:CheY-like chemotaxis protein